MEHKEELQELKNVYLSCPDKREFLVGIINYCNYLGFPGDKTKMMVSLVMGNLPLPGEEFTDCRLVDEEEANIARKLFKEMAL